MSQEKKPAWANHPAYIRGMQDYLRWAALPAPDIAPRPPYFAGTEDFRQYDRGWKAENNDLFDIIAAFQ